jgi:hypothetical protein
MIDPDGLASPDDLEAESAPSASAATTKPDLAPEVAPPEQDEPEEPESQERSLVVVPARRALELIKSGVSTASGATVGRMERSWSERPGARIRRVRRLGSQPLAFLYDLYPEARNARPIDVGLETIDVEDIGGTAVGGGDQRGGDFLPLKAFRGPNWGARWQRLRDAHNQLAMLPPIDVVKYGDRYWVIDGHNRVGLALYTGQVGIDANVVELVPPGARRTEPILPLATTVAASQAVRTAGLGQKPSHALAREDAVTIEPPDVAE